MVKNLINILLMHKNRWLSSRTICQLMQINERVLRDIVVNAIDKGHLIASGDKGYLYTSDWSVIEPSILRLESHAKSQWKRCQKLRHNAGKQELTLPGII